MALLLDDYVPYLSARQHHSTVNLIKLPWQPQVLLCPWVLEGLQRCIGGETPLWIRHSKTELTGHLEITTPVPRQAKSCQAFCRSQTAAWSVLGHLSLDPVFWHRRLKSILPATAVLILLETNWDRCTTG